MFLACSQSYLSKCHPHTRPLFPETVEEDKKMGALASRG